MKINFKKVVPIVTGALLLGSTIGFAASVAGQAATYPTSFADSVVVIGSASADSAAANDLAADLGKLTTSTGKASVSDGHLIVKGSDVLNYGESWSTLDSKLDSGDLPSLLADSTYKDTKGTNDNDEAYTQYLNLTTSGEKFTYDQDQNNNDKVASHLKLTDGTDAYTYVLDFNTGPKYDNSTAALLKSDFELTKLNILGDTWTIIDASASALASGPTKLTLMGGAGSATLKTGESTTMVVNGKSYTVAATVYSDKAQFTVNGESLSVDAGATDELSDGTAIGVTEISTSSKEAVADQVEFFLGARKLVLETGQKVNLNGADVDGSLVTITSDTANARLNKVVVEYAPSDDTWLSAGQSWTDPVFGKFKFVFSSVVKQGVEKLSSTVASDDGSLTFLNSRGKSMTLKMHGNGSASGQVVWGKEYTKANTSSGNHKGLAGLEQGNLLIADNDVCVGASLKKCEGIQILVVDSDGEARIYELSDVNMADAQMTFTDQNNNKDYVVDYLNGSNSMDLGFASITLAINQTKAYNASSTNAATWYFNDSDGTGTIALLNFTDINQYGGTPAGGFETSLQGALALHVYGVKASANLYNETGVLKQWNYSLDSDGNMQIDTLGGLSEEVSGSDTHVGLDTADTTLPYGAEFSWDSNNQDNLDIVYPGDKPVSADMFISPVSAVVSGAGVVPVVKDTELGSMKTSKDLVVVGGPAVNSIAAELLGLSFPTYGSAANSGFAADSATIRLFSGTLTPGKVALLVAGYDAKDTSAAAKALIAEKKFGTLSTTTASTYSYA